MIGPIGSWKNAGQWRPSAAGGQGAPAVPGRPSGPAAAEQPDYSASRPSGSPAAPQPDYSGSRPSGSPGAVQGTVSIGGTDNGGLMNQWPVMVAREGTSKYEGNPASNAFDRAMSDPLFYSPASQHLPTSGEPQPTPTFQQGPNAYRYPGSEGWVGSAPGPKR